MWGNKKLYVLFVFLYMHANIEVDIVIRGVCQEFQGNETKKYSSEEIRLIDEAIDKWVLSETFPRPSFMHLNLIDKLAKTLDYMPEGFNTLNDFLKDREQNYEKICEYFMLLFSIASNVLKIRHPFKYIKIYSEGKDVANSKNATLTGSNGNNNELIQSNIFSEDNNDINIPAHGTALLFEKKLKQNGYSDFDEGQKQIINLRNRRGVRRVILIDNNTPIKYNELNGEIICESTFVQRVRINKFIEEDSIENLSNKDKMIYAELQFVDIDGNDMVVEQENIEEKSTIVVSLAELSPLLTIPSTELEKDNFVKNYKGVLICAEKDQRMHLINDEIRVLPKFVEGSWSVQVCVTKMHILNVNDSTNEFTFQADISLRDNIKITKNNEKVFPFIGVVLANDWTMQNAKSLVEKTQNCTLLRDSKYQSTIELHCDWGKAKANSGKLGNLATATTVGALSIIPASALLTKMRVIPLVTCGCLMCPASKRNWLSILSPGGKSAIASALMLFVTSGGFFSTKNILNHKDKNQALSKILAHMYYDDPIIFTIFMKERV